MAGEGSQYDFGLEQRIIDIVHKIKKDRNRADFQIIHSMLEKGGIAVEKDDLRVFLNHLIDRGILLNLAKDKCDPEKESLKVSEKECTGVQNNLGNRGTLSIENVLDYFTCCYMFVYYCRQWSRIRILVS